MFTMDKSRNSFTNIRVSLQNIKWITNRFDIKLLYFNHCHRWAFFIINNHFTQYNRCQISEASVRFYTLQYCGAFLSHRCHIGARFNTKFCRGPFSGLPSYYGVRYVLRPKLALLKHPVHWSEESLYIICEIIYRIRFQRAWVQLLLFKLQHKDARVLLNVLWTTWVCPRFRRNQNLCLL